jgi:hypothetical protein
MIISYDFHCKLMFICEVKPWCSRGDINGFSNTLYQPCLPAYMPRIVVMCPVNMIQQRMVEAEREQTWEATEAACETCEEIF